jgi:hypothetical protein
MSSASFGSRTKAIGPEIVGIASKRGLQVVPTLGYGTGAQPVESADGIGAPREGVERHGPIGEIDGPLVEPVAGPNLRQGDEERRVLQIDAEGRVLGFRETGGVVRQEPGCREHGQRLSVPRIDGEGLFGLSYCCLVVLEIEIEAPA